MSKRIQDQLSALEARRAQLVARIERLQGLDRARQRREDTRRKILAGAVVLTLAEGDSGFGAWLKQKLSERLLRPADRALFDLPPR